MRFNWMLGTLTAAALPLLACGPQPDGVSADGVSVEQSTLLNGQQTTNRPEVGYFVPAGGGGCVGTMISSRTFVTNAGCIGYASMATGGTLYLESGTYSVDRTFSQGGGGTTDDLAYGHLTTATNVPPALIATTEPGAGYLTAFGFACTTKGCSGNTPWHNYNTYYYNGSTPSSIINGGADKGGPTFVGQLAENGPMARVAAGMDINGHDVGADTIVFRNDILSMDTAFNTDGISYRAQVQSQGWQAADQNGMIAGTTGQSLRLEGLQIWSPRAGVSVCYTGYVQNVGWQGEVCNGNLAGTVGQSLRMEAIKIRLASRPAGTNGVQYNTYVQGIGWQGWMRDNTIAGTTGQSRRIEAIAIQFY
jgi:hypothetical protein